jgi:8-oxo-dGTP pyrophosphatase MutT (NUDIX family)
MEPMMRDKVGFASLIPYRSRGREFEYYLQKRDAHAAVNPGVYGFFGGHVENGETPEDTLLREILEELVYAPTNHRYFSRYETASGIVHYYIEEVSDNFESLVHVQEGEFGRFLKREDIEFSPQVSIMAQLVLHQLDKILKQI